MTLADIHIQAFSQGNCKHCLLYFLRLTTRLLSPSRYTKCVGGKLQWGTCLPWNGMCYQPPQIIYFFALSKHKLGDETGKVADGGSNLQSDKKSWLTRTLTVSIDQCRMKPSKNSTAAYQWLDTSCWDGKIYLRAGEEPQRNPSAYWSFSLNFIVYVLSMGRFIRSKLRLLFCRDGRGNTHWLAECERSDCAFLPHEEDAFKRITLEDFTIFLVQMGSLKLQLAHICGSQCYVAE